MKAFYSGVAILFILVGVAGGYIWLQVNKLNTPIDLAQPQLYEVSPGASAIAVIDDLRTKGITSVPDVVSRLWFKVEPEVSQVRAGVFQLRPGMSLRSVFTLLAKGHEYQFPVSLVEGLTLQQWLSTLLAAPHLVDDTQGKMPSQWRLKLQRVSGMPDDAYPEGLFLADTYHYSAGIRISDILLRANQAMVIFLEEAWPNRGDNLPYDSPYDALIMASIIEKETAVATERPRIAGVFVNRLRKGMRLQTDPTVIYGIGDEFDGNLTRAHLREKTPYNTYVIKGLPPTPIAMPGREAINAALHPALTDEYYFVSKGDGSHQFSATLEAHNRAVNQYQRAKNRE
ncbi:endolytic transglycosylase MltG [Alteromonas sp. C1M14]|uniref:endolytic transglycosylase MltG n=1 Tax=Alteromonas sp. C1M14 TaxID=2841567 RepID=UPI001C07F988|nr:endolytic transglycosylase MltG [Alteromonas sp. C1M14]MBU2976719.1 endolytic transglycosylase MltG [Alteromonas sp. C1M14]